MREEIAQYGVRRRQPKACRESRRRAARLGLVISGLPMIFPACDAARHGEPGPSDPGPEPASWTVEAVPRVEIGTTFEPAATALHRPHSPWLQRDQVFVANSQREIRVFDLSGNLRRTIGRIGEGPGEFRQLWAFRPLSTGQVATFDIGRNRIQVLDSTGGFVRGRSVKVLLEGNTPVAFTSDGRLVGVESSHRSAPHPACRRSGEALCLFC